MKFRIYSILEYIFVFIMILQCNSVYMYQENSYNFKNVFLIMTVILLIVKLSNLKMNYSSLLNVIIFLGVYEFIMFIIFMVNYQNMSLNYITLYMVIFPLLTFLLAIYNMKHELVLLLKKFVQVVVILSIISLFFWIFGSQLNIIKPTGIVLSQWAGMYYINTYYGIYFETQRLVLPGINIIRNSGMFTEAPMWNVILCLAFITEKLILKENNRKFIIIILLTIVSSLSTTGVFILGLMYVYLFISNKRDKFIVVFVILMAGISYSLFEGFSSKLESTSVSIRLDDYRAGLLAWKDSLLVGHGTNGINIIQNYMNGNVRSSLGYSNGIFVVLASGGIIMALALLSWVIWMIFLPQINKNLKISGILFVLLLVTTIFNETYIFLFYCSLGYVYCLSYLKNKRKYYDRI